MKIKSVKFIQWSSTILLTISTIWLLVMGTMAVMVEGMEVTDVTKIGGVLILFVAPEKAAAFFGPHFKKKGGADG